VLNRLRRLGVIQSFGEDTPGSFIVASPTAFTTRGARAPTHARSGVDKEGPRYPGLKGKHENAFATSLSAQSRHLV
jgi:hypothetical protein